jgi:uncharacterized protein YbbC (DUF1343 family)
MRTPVTAFLLLLSLCLAAHADPAPKVKLGVDVLRDQNFAPLANQRVGLVANPASVDGNLIPTVDVLRGEKNVNLVALYGPEHGVWGDEYAGDKVDDRKDPTTGLPVFSLYGKTRKPTPEMLAGIDVLVFDLQDIGSRSYTYISTLQTCMEACAENNKTFVVLDRPNPLGGNRIEGGGVDPKLKSFVSHLDVPYLHGMTMGELAKMVQATQFPSYAKLVVIPMQGWTRDMVWDDTGLRWMPTSPHIPQSTSTWAYAATGVAGELSAISNGVGYTLPFEIVGSPKTDGAQLAEALRKFWPESPALRFRPVRFKPFYATFKTEPCQGVQILADPRTAPSLLEINYRLLEAMDAPALLAGAEKRFEMFDKVSGTDEARRILMEKGDLKPLFDRWKQKSEAFREKRKGWLLY